MGDWRAYSFQTNRHSRFVFAPALLPAPHAWSTPVGVHKALRPRVPAKGGRHQEVARAQSAAIMDPRRQREHATLWRKTENNDDKRARWPLPP